MTKRGQEVVATFTATESVVAALVATGMRNREIAREIGTSEQMIKNHCKKLFDKTGTDNKLRFTLFCQDHGIIQRPRLAETA